MENTELALRICLNNYFHLPLTSAIIVVVLVLFEPY
nr:MAG TPA_asm: hypothetical protein [Caudoviricetes sp.]